MLDIEYDKHLCEPIAFDNQSLKTGLKQSRNKVPAMNAMTQNLARRR